MVDKIKRHQHQLNLIVKKEDKAEVKKEFSSSLIQAVSAAQRELSGCEDRSEPDTETGDSHEDEAARRRRERALVRRPSYRKILTDLGGHNNMISEDKEALSEGDSGASSEEHQDRHHQHYSSHPSLRGSVLSHGGGGVTGVETLHTSSGGGAVGVSPPHTSNGLHPLHYAQAMGDNQGQGLSFIPAMSALGSSGMGSPPDEGTSYRKREIRLLKNREAARECRRKKKEYIKCLENRVAVLENQNKALIEELKSLKELYTGGGNKMM